MAAGRRHGNGRSARIPSVLAGALLLVALSGCTVARTETPSGSSDAPPSATDTAPPTTTPTAIELESPTTTPAPTATPKIGGVIRWTQVPLPAGLVATEANATQNALFGWSKGYLVFNESLKDGPVVPWTSSDGSNWRKSNALDVAGLSSVPWVTQVAEGPAGLLAFGETPGCAMNGSGCVPGSAKALWTSPDGRTWSRVELAAQFGGRAVGDVSAGSKGYMAISLSSESATSDPAVWLSANGRSWRPVTLPPEAFKDAYLASGAVLSGGYLIAGRIGSVAGYGGGDYPSTTPALWWSADGSAWSRVSLAGASAAPEAEAAVTRVANGRLVAHVVCWDHLSPPDGATQTWSSSDGRSWAPSGDGFPSPAVILTDGHQAMQPIATDAGVTVSTSPDGFDWTQRAITGTAPPDWFDAALGPAGLLVSSTDQRAWLAVLT
jgi:hypothetical protein